jgi:hypothetical protein
LVTGASGLITQASESLWVGQVASAVVYAVWPEGVQRKRAVAALARALALEPLSPVPLPEIEVGRPQAEGAATGFQTDEVRALTFRLTPSSRVPEFAWVQRADAEWFLYDLDADGAVDAFTVQWAGGRVGRRIRQGEIVDAPEFAQGPLVRPQVFDARRAQMLSSLAPRYFEGVGP